MEKELVNNFIKDFDRAAVAKIKKGDFDKACREIHVSAEIQYQWNQSYTDDMLEHCIENMSWAYKAAFEQYSAKNNVVLFYDGFGLDTRGLALIYLKALCDEGYSVICMVSEKSRHKQPEIKKVTSGKKIFFHYIEKLQGREKISDIVGSVLYYKPQYAFLYIPPSDVEACVAFEAMAGKIRRYQINLTDHAFWLGVNAFDYCIEYREYGACVSNKYRGIAADKIRLLHFYPYFDKSVPFEGLPFETSGRPVLFSGGSLYKTFDEKGTYYDIVEQIMLRHDDLLFIYAGTGNKSGLKKLQEKFPGRVYVLDERRDLYAVMKHCTLYLNTYPLLGGLMTQYAAIAGRLPLTLLKYPENNLDGLLLNHRELRLEFYHKDELLSEIDKLLLNENYRSQAEKRLEGSVVDERRFRKELKNLLEKGKTDFEFQLHEIDTTAFRRQYIHRFTKDTLAAAIINKKTVAIWWRYPKWFLYRIWDKLHK